jgi:DNA-binding NtrC family response regulator
MTDPIATNATETAELARWRETCATEIIGEAPALLEALEMAQRAARFDCPILITGESGTGKELLARAIHRGSEREQRPMVPVNCPAIPRELVESELFGHSKGAFTGATAARVGRFDAADGGTLFLDEIGEMDLDVQSKLLRVLQDYEVTPVGEVRSHRVNVRIVAATNRDLDEEAESGRFREDLYYRLTVLQIHLPALRERREDIPALLEHLLATLSSERGVTPPTILPDARERLLSYDWPGNIRELRNVVDRMVILLAGRRVGAAQLPKKLQARRATRRDNGSFDVQLPPDGLDLRSELARLEERLIRQALLATSGNKNQAAQLLGLKRTTLVEKLKKQPQACAVGA